MRLLQISILAFFIWLGFNLDIWGTVDQRHDAIKQVTGSSDDLLVSTGIISDAALHHIGALLGVCHELGH